MFSNRMVLGVEGEASFPIFPIWRVRPPAAFRISIRRLAAPSTFSETMLFAGSLRGRNGYSPGH